MDRCACIFTGAFQDPEPMSDIYLLLLIENCTSEDLVSIWTLLDISKGEVDAIFDDPLSTNHQHQLLNVSISQTCQKTKYLPIIK